MVSRKAATDRWGKIALCSGLALAAGCSGNDADGSSQAEASETSAQAAAATQETLSDARFDWFTYEGRDPVYADIEPGENQYLNPVLAGFYPDPSVTQVDGNYYLVNSTFSYFPGIPVFRSTDLVNWTQIGNVIDRPGMLEFGNQALSRGVFAPTIEHHDGTFYVSNTCVDCGGNFIVTADDPAGPWSDPIWTPDVGGIDPSLFFDEDGTVYMINNDAPEGEPRYEGHRAIWIRAVDPETLQPLEEASVIMDGGVRPEENPIWIEGPHIYKQNGWYYFSAAEGGTAINHSQVVARSRDIKGPYEPWDGNPTLTQRDLDPERDHPVTSVGHADLVQDDEGAWWATFLGVRPYEGDYYNTGRETYLLPVDWSGDWPVILERGERVGYVHDRPALPLSAPPDIPMNGNFTLTEDFDGDRLDHYWLQVRIPEEQWWRQEAGALLIEPRGERLGDQAQPSFMARRQQHLHAQASTALTFDPVAPGDEAGLAVFQNDHHYYAIGLTVDEDGNDILRLSQRTGEDAPAAGETVESVALDRAIDGPVYLRASAQGDAYRFSYALSEGEWMPIGDALDARPLSTQVAGGFVGAVFGMYAQTSAADNAVSRPEAD